MEKLPLVLTVNDREHELYVSPSASLLEVLHDDLGLSTVRYGCGEGVCGTCTVLLDDEPVSSCLHFAVQAGGHRLRTLEGLNRPDGSMHPLQECFLRAGGLQCGFCTPGMILTAYDLVARAGRPSTEEIRYALIGNLCRCTGYTKILEAVDEYAAAARGGERTPAGRAPSP
jgi:aerobic carbon-monoxide dehydrogenase small subunit